MYISDEKHSRVKIQMLYLWHKNILYAYHIIASFIEDESKYFQAIYVIQILRFDHNYINTFYNHQSVAMQKSYQELSQNNQIGQHLRKLVVQCVKQVDHDKAFLLLQFQATNIEKNVKVKSRDLKPKFKAGLLELTKNKSYSNGEEKTIGQKESSVNNAESIAQKIMQNCVSESNFCQILSDMNKICCRQFQIKNQEEDQYCQEQNQKIKKLYNQAERLLDLYECNKKTQLIEDFEKNKLIKWQNYEFEDEKDFKDFMNCLESLPIYQLYKLYLGKDLQVVRNKFKKQLRREIITRNDQFSIHNIAEVQKMFDQNPLINFVIKDQLNKNEKEILYNFIWQKQKVKDYALTISIPNSLQKKKKDIIERVMMYLVQNQLIKKIQYKSVIEAVMNHDRQKFYMIPSICNGRQVIHEFFKNQIDPYYFYAKQIGSEQCLQKMEVRFTLQIRKMLHQVGIDFSLYDRIEQILLSNQILQLWKIELPNEKRLKIIQFEQNYDELRSYRRAKESVVPLQIKAVAQLQQIPVRLDFKNLNYPDIVQLVSQLLNNYKLPKGQLTNDQYKKFEMSIQTSKNAKQYMDNLKVDYRNLKSAFYQRLLYIINKAPNNIDYQTVKNLAQSLLTNCDLMQIIDFKNLNNKQKQWIYRQIKQSKQIHQFTDGFNKLQALKSLKEFKLYMQNHFGQEGEMLWEYLRVYCQIQMSQSGQPIFKSSQQALITSLFKDKANEIRQIHESNQYKKFKEHYVFLLKQLLAQKQKNLQIRLIEILQESRVTSISSYVASIRKNDYKLDNIAPGIKNRIQVQQIYQQYLQFQREFQETEYLRKKMKLQKQLYQLRQQQILWKYQKQQRQQVIKGLIQHGENYLSSTDMIRQSQKIALISKIRNSPVYISSAKKQPKDPIVICEQFKQILSSQKLFADASIQQIQAIMISDPFTQSGLEETFKIMKVGLMKKKNVKDVLQAKQQVLKPKIQQLKKRVSDQQQSSPIKSSPNKSSPIKNAGSENNSPEKKVQEKQVQKSQQQGKAQKQQNIGTPVKQKSQPNNKANQLFALLTQFQVVPSKLTIESINNIKGVNPFESAESKKKFMSQIGVNGLMNVKKYYTHLEQNKGKIQELLNQA